MDELIYSDFIEPVVNSPKTFVPIIGEDMYVVGGKNLQEYVFDELANKHRKRFSNVDFFDKPEETLNLPYYEFLSKAQRCMKEKESKNFSSIYKAIVGEAIKNGSLTLRRDIMKLLKEADFPLILTTFCWDVIETKVKSKNYESMWHNWGQKDETNQDDIPVDGHTVYHLLGKAGDNWVYNERCLLDCLHSHQNTANSLSKYLKDCRLLCFGCNLPNWIFRFLWYPMTKLKDQQYPDSMREGLWDQADHAEDFDAFLDDIGYRCPDNLEEYLEALTKAFSATEKISEAEVKERKGPYKYDIFLSYKSEDKTVADKIYDYLTNKYHLVVWRDTDKNPSGGNYWERIKQGIEKSRYFMPVVSKTYLRKIVKGCKDGAIVDPNEKEGLLYETHLAIKNLEANAEKFKELDPNNILVYTLPVIDVVGCDIDFVSDMIEEERLPTKFFKDIQAYFFSDDSKKSPETFHSHDWSIYAQE